MRLVVDWVLVIGYWLLVTGVGYWLLVSWLLVNWVLVIGS